MPESIPTEHPHIVRTPGVVGGRPAIRGTRISVDFIARFLRSGTEPWEILATYPHLKAAEVYDAISYYYDHKKEIDREIEENTLEKMMEKMGLEMEPSGRVIFKNRDAKPVP